MEKKYRLSESYIVMNGVRLYRIIATKDFGRIKEGSIGGYVESEYNLSHSNDCWIYDKSKVYGDARVIDNAKVFEKAEISGQTTIGGYSNVSGETTKIRSGALIYGNARIKRTTDYICFNDLGALDGMITFCKSFDNDILVKSQWFEGNLASFKKYIATTYSGKYKSCYYKAIKLVKVYLK